MIESTPPSAQPRRGFASRHIWLTMFIAFVVGALLGLGVVRAAWWIIDDSRPGLTLQDVVDRSTPGFEDADDPSGAACGDRLGCVEGVVGEGVSIYRYRTLDLARQAVIYDDTDLYRSDRLVVEFEEGLTPQERFWLLQGVEGTWTGSDD